MADNDIDLLMDLDPIELSKDDKALDAIIAYHRQARARAEAGIKPKKESGPKMTLDSLIASITDKVPEAPPVAKGKGLRRF